MEQRGVVAIGVVGDEAVGDRARAIGQRNEGIAEAVTVVVAVEAEGRDTIVDRSVAVVIETVAEFRRTRISGGAGVVAVCVVGDLARDGRS